MSSANSLRGWITLFCSSVTRNGAPDTPVSCHDFIFDFGCNYKCSAGQITATPIGPRYENGEIVPGTYTVEITGYDLVTGHSAT